MYKHRGDVPKIKEGWVGKAKGLLQVIWERGFIDTNNLASSTLTGRKNLLGNMDVSLSLRHLMAIGPDFLNEEGMIEHIGAKLGVKVMLDNVCRRKSFQLSAFESSQKRARQYLSAYHAIDSGQVSAQIQQDCSKYGPVGLKKLLAKFRTHRYAIDDFDFKLLMNPDQKS